MENEATMKWRYIWLITAIVAVMCSIAASSKRKNLEAGSFGGKPNHNGVTSLPKVASATITSSATHRDALVSGKRTRDDEVAFVHVHTVLAHLDVNNGKQEWWSTAATGSHSPFLHDMKRFMTIQLDAEVTRRLGRSNGTSSSVRVRRASTIPSMLLQDVKRAIVECRNESSVCVTIHSPHANQWQVYTRDATSRQRWLAGIVLSAGSPIETSASFQPAASAIQRRLHLPPNVAEGMMRSMASTSSTALRIAARIRHLVSTSLLHTVIVVPLDGNVASWSAFKSAASTMPVVQSHVPHPPTPRAAISLSIDLVGVPIYREQPQEDLPTHACCEWNEGGGGNRVCLLMCHWWPLVHEADSTTDSEVVLRSAGNAPYRGKGHSASSALADVVSHNIVALMEAPI